jgi:GTP cyclohydrolase I
MDKPRIENAVREILFAIGRPGSEGLVDTQNNRKMYEEIFSWMEQDPCRTSEGVFSDEKYEELVLVKDISFYSMWRTPFGTVLRKSPCGISAEKRQTDRLSKLARVVETAAKRPQRQERLTATVADAIMNCLERMASLSSWKRNICA